MADKKDDKDAGNYEVVHGKAHPDHGKANTLVSEASDEAIEKEQNIVNDARKRARPPDWRDLKDADGKTYWDKAGDTPATTGADYESKTVPELKALADERGVAVASDAKKDDIVKALKTNDHK